MPRPLYEIAAEIIHCWPKPYFGAVPYLRAMLTMRSVKEDYGMDSGESIVVYFLSNATNWRGEDAKRIKAELRSMIK